MSVSKYIISKFLRILNERISHTIQNWCECRNWKWIHPNTNRTLPCPFHIRSQFSFDCLRFVFIVKCGTLYSFFFSSSVVSRDVMETQSKSNFSLSFNVMFARNDIITRIWAMIARLAGKWSNNFREKNNRKPKTKLRNSSWFDVCFRKTKFVQNW